MEGRLRYLLIPSVSRAIQALLLAFVFSHAHAAAIVCRVDIPAQSLSKELIEFSRQCKVKPLLLSLGNELDSVRGNKVVGDLELQEALRRMLAHTGWKSSVEGTDEVTIQQERHANLDIPPVLVQPSGNENSFRGSSEPRPPLDVSSATVEQVLITGSWIRGVDAITSPLVTLSPGEMGETGYSGVQSLINSSLPLASNNTPREDWSPVAGNFGFGEAINLHNLGFRATLTLVDGKRQPLTGLTGAFVDSSTVPSAAIERIEVLPDGASADYGSDAIAGVVNIILRHDVVGFESSVRYSQGMGGGNETSASQLAGFGWDGGNGMFLYEYTDRTAVPFSSRSYAANPDKSSMGGNDFRSIDSNPGNILNPMTGLPAFAIPPSQSGRSLSVSDLLPGKINLTNQLLGVDLYPQKTSHSFYASGEQEVTSWLKLVSEARFSWREDGEASQAASTTVIVPDSNPYYVNPFPRFPYTAVAYSFYDDFGNSYVSSQSLTAVASVGLKADLPRGWQSTLSLTDGVGHLNYHLFNWYNPQALAASLADTDPETAFDAFGAGSHTAASTLNQVKATVSDQSTSRVGQFEALADGPLFTADRVSAKLAIGIDLRQEFLGQHESATGEFGLADAYKREIASVFNELAFSFPNNVDLSLAARYEHYSDLGSTVNPKIGIRWKLTPSVKFRTDWGTSYRAPELAELDTSKNVAGLTIFPDPKSASGQSVVLYEEGNSPDLHVEKAKTWMVGIDWAPTEITGFKSSVTYYATDYRDKIAQPGPENVYDTLEDEQTWSAVIERNPSSSTVIAICNSRLFQGSVSSCSSTTPAAIVDLRLRNLSRTIDKGFDLAADKEFDSWMGTFNLSAQAAYLLSFGQAVTNSSPVIDVANTVGNPLRLKVRPELRWRQRRSGLASAFLILAANFQGSYADNVSIPNRRIASYSTIDAQLGYSTPGDHGIDVTLGVSNLLNRAPPFVDNIDGFDQANEPPLARLVALWLRMRW